ncbi:MAG: hypothetical protein ACHQ4G_13415 [Opitutales bacterium]
MNSPACGLRTASVIFGLVSLAHLVRLFVRFPVVIGSYSVPVWLSGVAFVVMGLLSWWMYKLVRVTSPAAA